VSGGKNVQILLAAFLCEIPPKTPELSLFCYRREYIFCAQRPTHGIVTLWQIEGDPVLFQTNVKLEGTAIGQIQEESHSRRIF
jgi:hypothetical protein